MVTKEEQRDYLFQKNWERVMTEEEGCETWTFPQGIRKMVWPDPVYAKFHTQHYWDLEEAFTFQTEIEQGILPKFSWGT